MLQTIYEGESSFSTTEGRIGHQQFPSQSKMHNMNNSGDHTARCFYPFWGISVFIPFFSLPLCIPVSVPPLSLNLFLLLRYLLCLSRTHSLRHSLALSRTLNSLRSAGLSFCVKRELKASQHSNVVGSGTSSWIKVFALVMGNAALWFAFLCWMVTLICVKRCLVIT